MARRVFLHVGTAKSGTTFLQDLWWRHRDELRERGLLDASGDLTERGVALRREIEDETDRLDRAPYEHLGSEGVARLTELGGVFAHAALVAGAFPADLIGKGDA